MNFNDYTEVIDKMTDLASEKEIIIPEKHSWTSEDEDLTFHKVNYYLPFDMYYIPRKFSNGFVQRYSSKLANSVYILGGNDKRYCGKAMNADRIKNHNADKNKGDWSYQLLFVPNNLHSGAVRFWNISFMDLLESILIERFSKYFSLDSDELLNKIPGISKEKAMKNLNNNEEYIDFASVVVDLIIKAYINFSKDNFVSASENDTDDDTKITRTQSAPFRFNMVNIPDGELITFDPIPEIKVKVISQIDSKCIFYDGQKWTLTGFTKKFLPEEMQNASGAYQGPKFFSYKDKTLKDWRDYYDSQQEIK